MKIQVILLLLLINITHLFSQIVINEIQPSNSGIIADNMGEYDDWIELYNAGNKTVDAGGLVLKDAVDTWAIPLDDTATILDPGEYLILWADDQEPQGKFHTNFKLSASNGEFLGLYKSDSNTVIDSVIFPPLGGGYSYGRCGDDHNDWMVIPDATPNAQNTCPTNIKKHLGIEEILVFPTVSQGKIRIEFKYDMLIPIEIKLYDITGKIVYINKIISRDNMVLNFDNYNKGLYFINLKYGKNQITRKIIFM